MTRTVEAVIDQQGNVRLLEPVHLPSSRRALVTILEDQQLAGATNTPHRGTDASAGRRPQELAAVRETAAKRGSPCRGLEPPGGD